MNESSKTQDKYKKAKDLTVIVNFEMDCSPEGILRTNQAKVLICEMILLARKRGRPSEKDEELDEAA